MAGSTSGYTKKSAGAPVKGTAVYHGGGGAAASLGGAAAGTFAAKLASGVSAAIGGSPVSVGSAGVTGSAAAAAPPTAAPPTTGISDGAASGAVEWVSASQQAAAARNAAKQAWDTGVEPPVWRPPTQTLQMLPDVWEEHPKVAVEAEIHGPFAVYKDIKGIGYTLGHVASQYPMATGFATKADAVAASTEAAASSVDWSYGTKTELKANAKKLQGRRHAGNEAEGGSAALHPTQGRDDHGAGVDPTRRRGDLCLAATSRNGHSRRP